MAMKNEKSGARNPLEEKFMAARVAVISGKIGFKSMPIEMLNIPKDVYQAAKSKGIDRLGDLADAFFGDDGTPEVFPENSKVYVRIDFGALGILDKVEPKQDTGAPEAKKLGGKNSRKILEDCYSILESGTMFNGAPNSVVVSKAYQTAKALGKRFRLKSWENIFYSAYFCSVEGLDVEGCHPDSQGGVKYKALFSGVLNAQSSGQ